MPSISTNLASTYITSTASTSIGTLESLFIANVLLPIQLFNLDHPRYINRDFRYCPNSNSYPPTLSSTSNTYTNQLTEFGNILLNLVITEFNNTFGKTYNTNQFAIQPMANDQNSICAYEIYSEPLGIIIEVWVEVAIIPSVSIRFISKGIKVMPTNLTSLSSEVSSYLVYSLTPNSQSSNTITMMRLCPMFWQINFNSAMTGSIISDSVNNTLLVTSVFRTEGDLLGLIFSSEDNYNNALFSYVTNNDYSNIVLSFTLTLNNLLPLDNLNGTTLTIEGYDVNGNSFTVYVRLNNYATLNTDGSYNCILDFDNLYSGYNSTASDWAPVYVKNITSMFFSLVPINYVAGSTQYLSEEQIATFLMSNIQVTGPELIVNNTSSSNNQLKIAIDYDNEVVYTPESSFFFKIL